MKIQKVPKAQPLPSLLLLKKYLDRWVSGDKQNSVQFNGSNVYENDPSAWIHFEYNGKLWRLHGDTRDVAVNEFLKDQSVIVIKNNKGKIVLRLASSPTKANGWYCYQVD
jgi:hypothetical protein